MTGTVQHNTTIAKARLIRDGNERKTDGITLLALDTFTEGLDGVKYATLAGTLNTDALLVDGNDIGIRIGVLQS